MQFFATFFVVVLQLAVVAYAKEGSLRSINKLSTVPAEADVNIESDNDEEIEGKNDSSAAEGIRENEEMTENDENEQLYKGEAPEGGIGQEVTAKDDAIADNQAVTESNAEKPIAVRETETAKLQPPPAPIANDVVVRVPLPQQQQSNSPSGDCGCGCRSSRSGCDCGSTASIEHKVPNDFPVLVQKVQELHDELSRRGIPVGALPPMHNLKNVSEAIKVSEDAIESHVVSPPQFRSLQDGGEGDLEEAEEAEEEANQREEEIEQAENEEDESKAPEEEAKEKPKPEKKKLSKEEAKAELVNSSKQLVDIVNDLVSAQLGERDALGVEAA